MTLGFEPIYEQMHRIRHQAVIAYNKRHESEPIGFDKYFAPTCVIEHSYCYDSYDAKYETLKYTQPKKNVLIVHWHMMTVAKRYIR